MGQETPTKVTAQLATSYTLTASPAIVTGMEVEAPSDGYYCIKCMCTFLALASGDSCYTHLAIEGNQILGTGRFSSNDLAGQTFYPIASSVDGVYLKKGETVSLYSYYANAGGLIYKNANESEGTLSIVKGGN